MLNRVNLIIQMTLIKILQKKNNNTIFNSSFSGKGYILIILLLSFLNI